MFEKLVLAGLPYIPRPIMRRLASRYIAGERLEDAIAKLEDLARRGHPGILDVLGENVGTAEEAMAAARIYEQGATAIAGRGSTRTCPSSRPTLGLTIDERLALDLFSGLAGRCRGRAPDASRWRTIRRRTRRWRSSRP